MTALLWFSYVVEAFAPLRYELNTVNVVIRYHGRNMDLFLVSSASVRPRSSTQAMLF